MTRRAYLALCWAEATPPDAALRMGEIVPRLVAEGWTRREGSDRISVWARSPVTPRVEPAAGGWGVIIGDLHRGAHAPPPIPCGDTGHGADASSLARWLSRNAWGSYVALLQRPPEGPVSAFRDPGGSLGCVTWSLDGGLVLVADALTSAPSWLWPRRMALDWNRIAEFVASPTAVTTPALFDDMTSIGPGQMQRLGDQQKPVQIWTPSAFARNDTPELAPLQSELVRRVEGSVEALLAPHRTVVMELSGGLDSSILAGTIGATGLTGRVSDWLNYRDDRPDADETRFAREVTERLGVSLRVHQKTIAPFDEETLIELGRFARPAIGAVDFTRDRFETDLLRKAGATGIVSGQGGDGVFFQFPSALIAADEFARRGLGAWWSPVLANVARRTRGSVWSVVRQVQAARRGREKRPRTTSALLTPAWAAEAPLIEHEWVRAARRDGLPPGKVLHVQGIALTHFYYEPSRRLAVADMLMPLFTQPVIELCLAIPTPDLAGGSYDRPFARETFSDRLPNSVFARRTKGALDAHVARRVTASADVLRPFLVDGCLAEAGVLDRDLVKDNLDPEKLMTGQARHAMHIINATAVEAWVRHWQGRAPDSPTAGRF